MLLQERGLQLTYDETIISYPNAVTAYPTIKGVSLFNYLSNRGSAKISNNILHMRNKTIPPLKEKAKLRYQSYMSDIHKTAKGFHVNDACIACGICSNVCPAKNIILEEGKPIFHERCESCMTCIQHCPKHAINYKNKTQK